MSDLLFLSSSLPHCAGNGWSIERFQQTNEDSKQNVPCDCGWPLTIIISMNFINSYTFMDIIFYLAISGVISLKQRVKQAEHIPPGLTLKQTRVDIKQLFGGDDATVIPSV